MTAVAEEYERARAALIAVRESSDGQALAFGLAEALGDLKAFGAMVTLTRQAEQLVTPRSPQPLRLKVEHVDHVVFAVEPGPALKARLEQLGASWEVKEAKAATEVWNPTLHPRDRLGRFTHSAFGGFGALRYSPDRTAPHEGEWARGPDGLATHWRQGHLELVTEALRAWREAPAAMEVHMADALAGESQPDTGAGKKRRAQAEALLWELEHGARPNPVPLYRSSETDPDSFEPWTEDIREVRRQADRDGGRVITLPRGQGRGLRINDYLHSGVDFGERRWIVVPPDMAADVKAIDWDPGLYGLTDFSPGEIAVAIERKALDWDPHKHPRDEHGRFAHSAAEIGTAVSAAAQAIAELPSYTSYTPRKRPEGPPAGVQEIQAVRAAIDGLAQDKRSDPAQLEKIGSMLAAEVSRATDARVQPLVTERYRLEREWSERNHEQWLISDQLDAFLVGPKHGRTDLTDSERADRDALLARNDVIHQQQVETNQRIAELEAQEKAAHRLAVVDVLSQVRPMGGEFRTAGTKFHSEGGLAPQAAYEAHQAALTDIGRLMPTAWVDQMNQRGSVHWDLWKRCRGWQRELPNSTDLPTSIQRRDFPSDEAWRAEVARQAQAAGVKPDQITFSGTPRGSPGVEARFAYWLPGPDSEVKAMAGDAGVYLHELGHRVQLLNPTGPLHDAQMRCLNERTGAYDKGVQEQLRPLSDIYPGAGYRPDERAIEDGFMNAYYGKVYGFNYGNQYNELLTMSMQDLFYRPGDLMLGDRRTYNWILGVMAAL